MLILFAGNRRAADLLPLLLDPVASYNSSSSLWAEPSKETAARQMLLAASGSGGIQALVSSCLEFKPCSHYKTATIKAMPLFVSSDQIAFL
ncbi:hypothetical protein HA466_0191000 [Hirschfeldia incana]|nr:hypothetical protein HA466_0191000 [Hirschfeldia incana]